MCLVSLESVCVRLVKLESVCVCVRANVRAHWSVLKRSLVGVWIATSTHVYTSKLERSMEVSALTYFFDYVCV